MARLAFDIGHGMNNTAPGVFDPGADPTGAPQEHGWVEPWVEALAALTRASGIETLVIEDTPVAKRDDKARGYDLLASFHMDSGSSTASGTSVLISPDASKATRALATKLGAAIATELGVKWRGLVERDNLAVLASPGTDMLVELIFISNKGDRAAWLAKNPAALKAAAGVLIAHYGGSAVAYDSSYSWVDADIPSSTGKTALVDFCEAQSLKLVTRAGIPDRALVSIHTGASKLAAVMSELTAIGGRDIIVRASRGGGAAAPDNSVRRLNAPTTTSL